MSFIKKGKQNRYESPTRVILLFVGIVLDTLYVRGCPGLFPGKVFNEWVILIYNFIQF